MMGCIVFPTYAQAQANDPLGAEELFRSAQTLLKAGDWPRACEKFKKSMELEASVSTQVKIAKCHEHDGLLATAWYNYQQALTLNRETKRIDRRLELDAVILARIAELEPRIPKLRISITDPPADLEVLRDGVVVARAALNEALPIDPGVHKLVARAAGHLEHSTSFEIAPCKSLEVDLVLTKIPTQQTIPQVNVSAPPKIGSASKSAVPTNVVPATEAPSHSTDAASSPEMAEPAPAERHHAATQLWSGVAAGGVGVVTLGVAGYFGWRTLSLIGDMNTNCVGGCSDHGVALHDQAVRAQTAGLVLAGIGSALLATGLALYVTAPTGSRTDQRGGLVIGPGYIAARGYF